MSAACFPVQFLPGAFVSRGVNFPFATGAQSIDGPVAKSWGIRCEMHLVPIVDMSLGPAIRTSAGDGSPGARHLLTIVVRLRISSLPLKQRVHIPATADDSHHNHSQR
jgi:hypothetical protein